MARFFQQVRDKAQKFVDKLRAITGIGKQASADSTSPVGALHKFLSSYGPQAARLSRTSRAVLLQQNETQDQQMRSKAIDQIRNTSKREIDNAINKYTQHQIDIKALRSILQTTLKRQALASAIVGVRGVGNLTDNVLLAVKRQLAVQLSYLDGFLEDIQTRTVTQRDRARAAQYANSAWSISQTAARQFNLDTSGTSAVQLEEMRKLGGSEHCDDCIEMADHWEPFGTLPPIGQGSVCAMNCRCTMIVRPITEETRDQSQTTQENPVPQDE